MKPIEEIPCPQPSDASGIVSWAHIGDLHLTTSDAQNYRDLHSIVDVLNNGFAGGLNFTFLPGDNAEHGQPEEYRLVRAALDRLRLPWYSIIGDHDLHTRSFEPWLHAMLPLTHYGMVIGGYSFIALNAFSTPAPDSFSVDEEQLLFLETQLSQAASSGLRCVLFMHCYPSDLKVGYERLRHLLVRYQPLAVDMGHTHYNEIARDEACVYTTTRSTGQIEEGPVGFSVTNLDHDCVSWKFRELGASEPFVMITSPSDWRLTPRIEGARAAGPLHVRVWSESPVSRVFVEFGDREPMDLVQVPESNVWQLMSELPLESVSTIRATAQTADGRQGFDAIQTKNLSAHSAPLAARDQENAIGAWPERGIPGTQLGPNKNGRKW